MNTACTLPLLVKRENTGRLVKESSSGYQRKEQCDNVGTGAALRHPQKDPSKSNQETPTTDWEAQWPHGWCARLQIEHSGFEPYPGTLSCVLGQGTLLSQYLSPPRWINGYRRI